MQAQLVVLTCCMVLYHLHHVYACVRASMYCEHMCEDVVSTHTRTSKPR